MNKHYHIIALLALLIFSNCCFGQSFHFNDTSTTLIKTTDQSPAHWYIEIFNDVGIDTNIRWKANLQNIQTGWEISFDDQNSFYPSVLDNDSNDFVMYSGLAFPQKLIIGNTLNGVSGSGSVYFDIYDPNDPSNVTTIEYEFIVSKAPTGVEESDPFSDYTLADNLLSFRPKYNGAEYRIYTINGALLSTGKITDSSIALPEGKTEINLIKIFYMNRAFSLTLLGQ